MCTLRRQIVPMKKEGWGRISALLDFSSAFWFLFPNSSMNIRSFLLPLFAKFHGVTVFVAFNPLCLANKPSVVSQECGSPF